MFYFSCPVDPFVFPELDKSRAGDQLEARFNAFKIPESNFLVFEATVKTCREGCQPVCYSYFLVSRHSSMLLFQVYCQGPAGRNEPSFGRRKRSVNDTEPSDDLIESKLNSTVLEDSAKENSTKSNGDDESSIDFPEQVREMIEVFESRDEIDSETVPRKLVASTETLCITPSEYHGLITAIILLMILLFSITLVSGLTYRSLFHDIFIALKIEKIEMNNCLIRKYWRTILKNGSVNSSSPLSFTPSALHQSVKPQFHTASRNTMSLGTAAGGSRSTGIRPSLSLINGTLQKTFATG